MHIFLLQSSNTSTSNTSKKPKETSIPVKEIFERKDIPSKKTSVMSENLSFSSNSMTYNVQSKLVENRSSSIVSGSQKLKDLQDLHRELNRSSYEPPKPLGMVIIITISYFPPHNDGSPLPNSSKNFCNAQKQR